MTGKPLRQFAAPSVRRRLGTFVLAALLSLASAAGATDGPPSDEGLVARIEALERAVFLKQRPDDRPLEERIAFLEGLPGAEKSVLSETVIPGFASTSDPVRAEDQTEAEDSGNWRSYPDFEKEKVAVEETFASFKGALKAGDIEKAASLVDDGRRDVYSALFAHRPEAMASFADLLDGAEITFLSDPEEADPAASSTLRTAEYAVNVEGFTFYVRWIKTGEKWVLFDF